MYMKCLRHIDNHYPQDYSVQEISTFFSEGRFFSIIFDWLLQRSSFVSGFFKGMSCFLSYFYFKILFSHYSHLNVIYVDFN